MTAAVLRKLYIVDKVQDYNIPHDKAAHPVICEDCHFTNMWKTRLELLVVIADCLVYH